jgi:hypothetical protein
MAEANLESSRGRLVDLILGYWQQAALACLEAYF